MVSQTDVFSSSMCLTEEGEIDILTCSLKLMCKVMQNAEMTRWLVAILIQIKFVDSQAIRIWSGRSMAITLEELYAAFLDSKYAL